MRAEEEQKHRQDVQANNRPFRGGPEGEPSFYMVGDVHCAAGRMIAGWMIFLGHALPRYQAVASRGRTIAKHPREQRADAGRRAASGRLFVAPLSGLAQEVPALD